MFLHNLIIHVKKSLVLVQCLTFRLRRIIADRYHIDPKNIHGYVLGEHGNSAFAAWSTVNVAGLGLEHVDEYFHF